MLKLGNVKKGSIVVDMDDVLTYTTNLWFYCVMNNKNLLTKIKPEVIPLNYNYNDFFNYPLISRPTYLFSDWLLKESLTEKEKQAAMQDILKVYLNESDNFYKEVITTRLGEFIPTLFKYKHFNFDKVYVVTRTFDIYTDAKIKCIKRILGPIIENVEILFVDINEKKSDVIKDIENISIIVDDELSNMYDYLDNSGDNINDCIMLIPLYSYNSIFDPAYLEKATKRNIMVEYYKECLSLSR